MPAKMFGVQTKDDFYAKYIAQGCWTRCLQCQKGAGIAFTNSSDNFKSNFVEKCAVHSSKNNGVVCTICHEKGVAKPWVENLSCDMHGCGKCGSIFPTEHWSTKMLENHKGFDRDLVCNSCAQQGFSPGKYEVHTCHECELTLGHGRFDPDVLKNAKKQKGSKKVCKDML